MGHDSKDHSGYGGEETVVAPVNLEDGGEPLEQDEEVREVLVESVEEEGL